MATAKKCDRCGRYYEGNRNYVYTDENDVKHIINSFRIGNWDQKSKRWISIASGYDLCSKCVKIFSTSSWAVRTITSKSAKLTL